MSEERPLSRRGFLRGVAGAGAVAGASGTAAAQGAPPPEEEGGGDGGDETAVDDGDQTEADGGDGTETGGGDGTETEGGDGTETEGGGGGGGGGSETVTLVDFAFEPGTDQPLYITPGTTVTFVWETSTHNIVVDSQPGESDWEGHEDIEDAGFETEHTFEAEGEYEFHCQPHLNQGMEGTIVVNQQGAPPAQEGSGPTVPASAKTLGIASSVALGSTLGLAYVFLKYGGGRRPAE